MSAERKRPTPMAREQAPIQWDEEARRAAAAVIAREEAAAGLRSFGFPKRAEPHADPAPPSVFEEPWRQGRTEKTPDGETRVWVSENCYVPLESDSILLADLHQARAGTRICTVSIGKRKARGDLFDHLKPKYLKPESPGCAAGCEDANAE